MIPTRPIVPLLLAVVATVPAGPTPLTRVTDGARRVARAGAPSVGGCAPTATIVSAASSSAPRPQCGLPHYETREVSAADSLVLRHAYGIENPHRLYLSDSSGTGLLTYDTRVKTCRTCLVNSYIVGFVSVRAPGESWEQVERRLRDTPRQQLAGARRQESAALEDLDPEVRPLMETMLRDATAAGFRVHVRGTYRSTRRQAFLLSLGGDRTHTLTSFHAYGRAMDVVIDDGNRMHARTRADWIGFRGWLTRYRGAAGEGFRILGAVDQTWDWPHVEVLTGSIGFHSIDEAIARGRACLAFAATTPCDFAPPMSDPIQRWIRS